MQNPWQGLLFLDKLVGHSPEISQIRNSIQSMGKSNQNITIVGEAGTEKLTIARDICENCDLTGQLLMITDASRLNSAYELELWNQIQKEEAFDHSLDKLCGVVVVQDIEHTDAKVQAQLLNLARKGYLNHPETNKIYSTEFRLIVTTTPRINMAMQEFKFDSELYFSLAELTIKLPPLTERKQDIPLLFDHYLNQICQELDRPLPTIDFEIFNQMLKHNWLGNIKELASVTRTLILSSPEGELLVERLPFFNKRQQFNKIELQDLGVAISQVEAELIEKALRKFGGNQSRAAQMLGISEPNMRFKMKKLGINKQDFILGTES